MSHTQNYTAIQKYLKKTIEGYKIEADKKRRALEFQVGDLIWTVLTKDRLLVGECNKLLAKKIEPLEIIKKINSNGHRLKAPSHIRTADVFMVCLLHENGNEVECE